MGAVSLVMGACLLASIQDRTGGAETASLQKPQQVQSQAVTTPEPAPSPTPARQVLGDGQVQVIQEFLDQQEGQWSVYLQDLDSGAVFLYEPDTAYYPASLLKAPFVYWLCLQADAGEIDLDNTLLTNHWKGSLAGTPWEKYDQEGQLPAAALIWLAVARSDNTATDRLNRAWSTQTGAFQEFLTALGFSNPQSCVTQESGIQGTMTVQDAGKIMEALYHYFDTSAPHAAMLRQAFLDAEHELLYVPAGVETAKKYGSWDYAFHDMVLVYGEHPYILCVMSDQGSSLVDYPTRATWTMGVLGQMVWDMLEGTP